MKVIIVGAGLVGSQLARHLIQQKDDVVLVERSSDIARHASNRLDCLVLQDAGNRLETLEEAGIAKADALVCVTDSDEVNMITCGLAASRYPKLLKIARVRNPDYAEFGGLDAPMLGVDRFVHPDVEAARAVLQSVEHGASGDVWGFEGTAFSLGSLAIARDSVFTGKPVQQFRELVGIECLVVLIERGEAELIPDGSTVLESDDRIHVLAREEELKRIFDLNGRVRGELRRIGIVGGSRVGALVAEGLIGQTGKHFSGRLRKILRLLRGDRRRVVIIERDYEVCKELSNRFPDALVLNEDISDESFVAEEGIEDLDLLITATEDQELNMIAALYLKSRGVKKAVALVSGPGYAAIARRLGIDVVVPIKSVVVDSILSRLLGGGVTGVHRIGQAEILRIELAPSAPVLGRALAMFKLADRALVLLVTRHGETFIPHGDYVFSAGDQVLVLVAKGGEPELARWFGTRL